MIILNMKKARPGWAKSSTEFIFRYDSKSGLRFVRLSKKGEPLISEDYFALKESKLASVTVYGWRGCPCGNNSKGKVFLNNSTFYCVECETSHGRSWYEKGWRWGGGRKGL